MAISYLIVYSLNCSGVNSESCTLVSDSYNPNNVTYPD